MLKMSSISDQVETAVYGCKCWLQFELYHVIAPLSFLRSISLASLFVKHILSIQDYGTKPIPCNVYDENGRKTIRICEYPAGMNLKLELLGNGIMFGRLMPESRETVTGADPGFFLGGGAPLRYDVTDRHVLCSSPHHSCGNCRRGHCSPLQWTGLSAEGERD